MKKLITAMACLVLAACGDGSSTDTTQKTADPKTVLLAVMGTFSTSSNEHPITIQQSVSFFQNISSLSLKLKNESTGQEYPFTFKNMSSATDTHPPAGFENLQWTVITANFTASPKPPIGTYKLTTGYNFRASTGLHVDEHVPYTVQ